MHLIERVLPAHLRQPLIATEGTWGAYLLLLFGSVLPLFPPALPLMLVALVLRRLVARVRWRGGAWPGLDPRSPGFWSMLFLLLHLIGMAWTTNTDFGWFDIGIKLPLFILPALAFLPGRAETGREAVVMGFVLGNVVAVLLSLGLATVHLFQADEQGWLEFYSSRFSAFLHPSYFAWYLCIALAAWLLGDLHGAYGPAMRWVITAILCAGVVLTGSRMGWIALPLVLSWVVLARWQDRLSRATALWSLAASIAGACLVLASSVYARERLMEMFRPVQEKDAATSSAERVLIWRSAREVISKDLPWGTGTGDVKDELIASYHAHGFVHGEELRLNAHDQFLQSAAALGLPGAIALAAMFLLPLLAGSRDRTDPWRALRACVLVITVLNLSVESMLETQAGVMAWAFTCWVLWWPRAMVASSRP